MNKIMFDILLLKKEGDKRNIRQLATALYKPYSIVEHEYNRLVYDGFINNGNLTNKALCYLEEHCITNAVILAAGVSSRFVPLCFETPKALLPVNGEVMIERQIKQLREKGIEEIVLVLGHMKEKFYYLIDKYGVKAIETDTYKVRNNHASVFAAKAFLGNTIVTSADLYFRENIFQKYVYDAYYCTIYQEGITQERAVETDAYDRIIDTYYGASNTWVTLGYACFDKRFSDAFIEILEREYNLPETMNKFWADIQDEHLLELYMYAKRVDADIIYEFDSLEELRSFDKEYINNSGSRLLAEMAERLETTEGELCNFKPITKEDLARGFLFDFERKKYICRINKSMQIEQISRYDDTIQELVNMTECFESYYKMTLPLCAAENVISPFANLPLSLGFQERYIVGNTYSYDEKDNFIGSTYLLPFYELISEKCEKIFHAKYADARTLTGMNCLMMVLTAMSKIGQKVLILGSSAGGHSSVKPIAERLGLDVDEVPFDFLKQDVDYVKLNNMIKETKVDFVLLAPSDIIRPFDVWKMDTSNTILLYDVSQMLGLIGAGVIDNPLDKVEKNIVIFGGTHKTLPGPASGLILTNDVRLHELLERTINPIYIRHTQMHQKVSLLFTLVEFETFGRAYEEHIVELSNALAKELDSRGFLIGKCEDCYTKTHEVFMYTDKELMERVYDNCIRMGITLNKKHKQLFHDYGIRFGTQEIARYGWPKESMSIVADIIYEISLDSIDTNRVIDLLNNLPGKKIQFTFDKNVMLRFEKLLQNEDI